MTTTTPGDHVTFQNLTDQFPVGLPDRRRTRSEVLAEIADEIAAAYPLHAQWLRNMADDRRKGER